MSIQKKMIYIAILLFGIGGIQAALGQTLTYKQSTGGEDSIRKLMIHEIKNGFRVNVINPNKVESASEMDRSGSFLKWNYKDPANGTDIFAKRIGNAISITGQYKNETYEDQLEVDDDPWYQDRGLGLKTFITSDHTAITFWSTNPDDLKKITKFEVNKEKIEKIQINGQEIETVYAKISLPGALKLFWSGDMWFRKSNGTYVCSKMKRGPGSPLTTVQLINEE